MKICIIGGSGNFGQLFAKLFKAQKHEVFSIGRTNINKLESNIKKSDVIILSVPAEAAKSYYNQLSKITKKSQLVVDISSVMSENRKELSKLNCQTVFLHPLFAPNVENLKLVKYILAPVNSKNSKNLKEIINCLKDTGSLVIESTVNRHEKVMAHIQALSHFNNILFAKVMANSGITVEEIEIFTTTFFRLQFDALSRIFSQGSSIYADIQFNNKAFNEVLKSYNKNFTELTNIVKNKDYDAYENIFKQVIYKLAPLLKDSFAESQALIKNLPANSKKVGYLGPASSYSEMAAEYLKPGANFGGHCYLMRKVWKNKGTKSICY